MTCADDAAAAVSHRDLKTSNILLSKGGTTAKIGDVGLAKITLTDLQSSLATVGTFVYAAPELLMGDRCTEKVCDFGFGQSCRVHDASWHAGNSCLQHIAIPGNARH